MRVYLEIIFEPEIDLFFVASQLNPGVFVTGKQFDLDSVMAEAEHATGFPHDRKKHTIVLYAYAVVIVQ